VRSFPHVTDADDAPPISEEPPTVPALPLQRLVELLPDDVEPDARWGARRQGERIPFSKPLSLRRIALEAAGPSLDGSEFDGWALNVCHGGMRIITEESLRAGDQIRLEVMSSGTMYRGDAKVCWVRIEADGVIAGVEFFGNPRGASIPPPDA
jgi:hypothetical protein